ncbi:restriction endonuclease subunit S [Frigidibacter sp. ROC022]|uniref:restriction endonuclease subunit S n=1 Tax=Frigidibacter sp. ROC022 TaxID=2971796 RepID=UPI00215B66C9|nr:restriction endonuclease subunit S [Frigidibacter sp. ROC022]MCR8726679.1 restriction endonuclease subunit S [Frigidibacter sp. ROC022]
MTNMVQLDDVMDFIRGITFKPDQLVDVSREDAVVCMRTKNVQRDLDESDLIAIPKSIMRDEKKYLKPGDVLVSSANSWELVGKCSYVGDLDYLATAGGFISIVRPKKGKTHPRFLYHWLTNPATQHAIRHLGRQTTNISNLDVKRFKKLDIPDFDFHEQQTIAEILDKADGIRRKREAALRISDDLLGSAFLEMFGDPVRNPHGYWQQTLGEVASFISGGTPSKKRADYWEGNFPWVSPKDMKVDLIYDAEDHVSEVVFSETSLKRIPANTPLIVVRGMILAHTVPIALTQREVAINQDMKAVKFNSEIDPMFGFWSLKVLHNRILSQVDTAAHGTKRLDTSRLQALPILVPGDNLQSEFVAITQKFGAMRARLSASLNEASQMFDALSQRAFRGEL